MPYLSDILLVQAIFLVAVVTPGPDFVVISAAALRSGRWTGLATVAGTTLGMSVWVLAAMVGFSYVLAHMAVLASVLRVAGGLYLLYLGVQLIRSSFQRPNKAAGAGAAGGSPWRGFARGLLVNLGNPKALVLFTSLAALLVKPNTPAWVLSVSGAGILVLTFIWYLIVVLMLTHPGVHARFRAVQHWFNRLAGATLAAFGIRLIAAD